MSLSDYVIKISTFPELFNYILYKNKDTEQNAMPITMPITIYHIHVGSKTYIAINNVHNHEYTDFLKTLFNDPLKQFSPELISQLSQYLEINIHNVVILIDPCYDKLPKLEGFLELSDPRSDKT